jgi:CRISPR-associated protein Cas2
MQRYLVAYDIPDDTTRRLLGDLLEEHGLRVQRSLFELKFKNEAERELLIAKIRRLIDPEADSVRFYAQCIRCLAKAKELGNFPGAYSHDAVYFF